MCSVAKYIDDQIAGCTGQITGPEAIEWAQLALILRRAQRQHEERCKQCSGVLEMVDEVTR